MTRQEIQKRVIRVVIETLDLKSAPEKVTPESRFVDDLGADSLDLTELVLQLEEEFDIAVPDEDADRIISVQAAIDYIARVLNTTVITE